MKILVLLLAIGVLAKKGKKQVNSLYVLKFSTSATRAAFQAQLPPRT